MTVLSDCRRFEEGKVYADSFLSRLTGLSKGSPFTGCMNASSAFSHWRASRLIRLIRGFKMLRKCLARCRIDNNTNDITGD